MIGRVLGRALARLMRLGAAEAGWDLDRLIPSAVTIQVSHPEPGEADSLAMFGRMADLSDREGASRERLDLCLDGVEASLLALEVQMRRIGQDAIEEHYRERRPRERLRRLTASASSWLRRPARPLLLRGSAGRCRP